MAGLGGHARPATAVGVFLLTMLAGGFGAGGLLVSVGQAASRQVPFGILLVGVSYGGAMAGRRGGSLSAALVGLALLLAAHTAHREIRWVQDRPMQTLAWSARTVIGLVVATAVLDGVVALAAGGGEPRPGRPSTLSVAAGCAVVCAIVALVTAVADGANPLHWRTDVPENDRPL